MTGYEGDETGVIPRFCEELFKEIHSDRKVITDSDIIIEAKFRASHASRACIADIKLVIFLTISNVDFSLTLLVKWLQTASETSYHLHLYQEHTDVVVQENIIFQNYQLSILNN